MIAYSDSVAGLGHGQLEGFFEGWLAPLSPEAHLRVLEGSDHVVLARDDGSGRVVGFVTAISDGVLSAYIPLLEVLPDHRGRGIGTELMRRMLEKLAGLTMVDLMCDEELRPFYERLGMQSLPGMTIRRHEQVGP
jgi:ribosomal protein S18 acetylase RimI-like enzyme